MHHAVVKDYPTHSVQALMHSREYARDNLSHASLMRELLERSSVSADPVLLLSCRNMLLKSLRGLLTHSVKLPLTGTHSVLEHHWKILSSDRADVVPEAQECR